MEPPVAAALGPGVPPILPVPRYGSKTSSSAVFIAAVEAPFAVVSAGWRKCFGHPKPEVLARYANAHVPVFNTAEQGAVPLDFPPDAGARREQGWRQRQPRCWRE
jgi:competence protein ComEC